MDKKEKKKNFLQTRPLWQATIFIIVVWGWLGYFWWRIWASEERGLFASLIVWLILITFWVSSKAYITRFVESKK